MQRIVSTCLALALACLMGSAAQAQGTAAPTAPVKQLTADHSKFDALKKQFRSGPEVTAACLSCHTEASSQVMHSIHWTWEYEHPKTGQVLGKKHVLNSFCGNVASNETRCTSCHAGYGWTDVRAPMPDDPTKVDCLACHDKSGQYTKQDNLAGEPPLTPVPAGAKTITGAPAWAVDLAKAAQSVGQAPGRENCGACHFYGGGGDNVKHGDLSSALFDPAPAVDVHMSREGANFNCSICHVSKSHVFAGSRFNTTIVDSGEHKPGERRDVATCVSCHGQTPHEAVSVAGVKLNDHTDRVACQTCHIPEFAARVATKMRWDWSTAGRLKDGKPYHEEGFVQSDGKRLDTYLSTKGDFAWAEDVAPHYAWFDGQVEYTLSGDAIDPAKVVEVNRVNGEAADPNARIFPFKRMEGRQAYDTRLNKLVYNHVYGPDTDTALWSNFDWSKSIRAAMDYMGVEYSGEFDFVDTYMYWPITHMVAPAADALKCKDCHAGNGRLAAVPGIYMPGAGMGLGGMLGLALLSLAMLGVAGHGALRLLGRDRGAAHHG